MTPRYAIRFLPELDLLDIEWRAQFTTDDIVEYAEDLQRQFAAHGFKPGYRLRIDMSYSAVQTQAAIATFASYFGDFPVASKIAIVTPSTLARLQVLRVMRQPHLRVFRTPDEAWQWLIDDSAANDA